MRLRFDSNMGMSLRRSTTPSGSSPLVNRLLAAMLPDGTANKERLDDIVAARLFVWELGDLLLDALTELGIPRDDLFDGGRETIERILDDMPMMRVEYALRRANFKNGSYRWTTHDIHDLAMLGRAIPYCDIVVTEKHAAHQARVCAARRALRNSDPARHRRPAAAAVAGSCSNLCSNLGAVRCRRVPLHAGRSCVRVGWPMGVEPITFGSTIRCSAG
jgi:hypothetical protein